MQINMEIIIEMPLNFILVINHIIFYYDFLINHIKI